MVEEIVQAEKEARKARRKNRLLYVIIGLDIILLGYAIFEIISLIVTLTK